MQTETKTTVSLPALDDVKAMAQESGPCLSVILSVQPTETNDRGVGARIRAAGQKAEQELARLNLKPNEIRDFLDPVLGSAESDVHESLERGALAIYRSLNGLWHFRLPSAETDRVVFGDRFYVMPLVKFLSEDNEFYLLALSQKNARLLRCTHSTSEQMELPPSVPTNLFDFNQHSQPDHRLENRAHGGQKGNQGSHAGMMVAFGTGSDADQKDEYLYHFFNEMDKQLQSFLRDKPLPLIVTAVDYELALYHKVSEYRQLVPGGVEGAPDSLKGGEMHARALEVLKAYNQSKADAALAQFGQTAGDRISTQIPDILASAVDGRVLYLFLAEGAQIPGRFDESTHHTTGGGEIGVDAEDLINLAALQTVAHAGQVFLLPRDKMPERRDAAAMWRY